MPKNNTCWSPNYLSIDCTLDYGDREYNSHLFVTFACYSIIAILSPVAVAGNALILAAIWKKTFQRTPFHTLLSGLAFTDLCTGLIAQPLMAAPILLALANPRVFITRSVLIKTIWTIANASSAYFVSLTLFITTLMSIERWLHMSRRSLVTSGCGYPAVTLVLLIPIPLVVCKAVNTIKVKNWVDITIAVGMLFCYLATSVTYFKVFRIIRQHQQQVQGNQSAQNFGQPAINLAKYKKTVVTILYILALFSFCFLPFIVSLTVSVHVADTIEVEIAISVSFVLLFLSSSLNPCLYLWRMNDIRNGVKQLFCAHG